MSDMNTKIAALLADKANTRLALATALVARNAECEALRMRGAGAGKPAPKVVARSEFASHLDERVARRKELLAMYFVANPHCRSVTPAQLAEFAYYSEAK